MSSIEFKPVPHTVRPGVIVHEVWIDGVMMASITPGDDPFTMRVISNHLDDLVRYGSMAWEIKFRRPGQ